MRPGCGLPTWPSYMADRARTGLVAVTALSDASARGFSSPPVAYRTNSRPLPGGPNRSGSRQDVLAQQAHAPAVSDTAHRMKASSTKTDYSGRQATSYWANG